MISFYPTLKLLHLVLVVLSGTLFVARGVSVPLSTTSTRCSSLRVG